VTYAVTQGWAVRKSGISGLIYQDKRTTEVDSGTSTGKNLVFKLECFVPASYGAEVGDRIYINANEFFRVQDIEKYRFPNVHVLMLVEDDRLAYTP
jgi:hypothetical protein